MWTRPGELRLISFSLVCKSLWSLVPFTVPSALIASKYPVLEYNCIEVVKDGLPQVEDLELSHGALRLLPEEEFDWGGQTTALEWLEEALGCRSPGWGEDASSSVIVAHLYDPYNSCNFANICRPSAPRRLGSPANMVPVTAPHSVRWSRKWRSPNTANTLAVFAERMPWSAVVWAFGRARDVSVSLLVELGFIPQQLLPPLDPPCVVWGKLRNSKSCAILM